MTTVLIADDEKDIRSALKIYLKPEGYELLEAADGKQALQMVKEKKVDLVLLDIMMPQMDGIKPSADCVNSPIFRSFSSVQKVRIRIR